MKLYPVTLHRKLPLVFGGVVDRSGVRSGSFEIQPGAQEIPEKLMKEMAAVTVTVKGQEVSFLEGLVGTDVLSIGKPFDSKDAA